jgi:hypothetical protein
VWGGVLETTKGNVFRKESRHRSEKSANSLDKSQKQIGNGCVVERTWKAVVRELLANEKRVCNEDM